MAAAGPSLMPESGCGSLEKSVDETTGLVVADDVRRAQLAALAVAQNDVAVRRQAVVAVVQLAQHLPATRADGLTRQAAEILVAASQGRLAAVAADLALELLEHQAAAAGAVVVVTAAGALVAADLVADQLAVTRALATELLALEVLKTHIRLLLAFD